MKLVIEVDSWRIGDDIINMVCSYAPISFIRGCVKPGFVWLSALFFLLLFTASPSISYGAIEESANQPALNKEKAALLTDVERAWLKVRPKVTLGPDMVSSKQTTQVPLTPDERFWLAANPSISICVDPSWMPFEQINKSGKYEGMVSEYMDLISSRLGVKFVLHPTKTFEESLLKMSSGECRILTSWGPAEGLKNPGLVSKPYMKLAHVLAIREERPFIRQLEGLADDRVGAVANYPVAASLKNIFPDKELTMVKNVDQGVWMVASGEVDAFASSLSAISYSIQKQKLSNVKIGGVIPGEGPVHMVASEAEPVLVSLLDKAIDSITHEDRTQIANRWVSVKYEQGFDSALLWKMSLGFLLLLLAILAWNQYSRRKRGALAAAALAQSEHRYRTLVESAPYCIHEINLDGQIISMNLKGLEMMGVTEGSAVHGRNYLKAVCEKDRPHIAELLEQALAGQASNFEFEAKTKEGPRYYSSSFVPIKNQSGQVERLMGITVDITHRKESEEELKQHRDHLEELVKERTGELSIAKEAAEAANQAKSIFLANMSHELRTPLNVILGFSELIALDRDVPESVQEQIGMINDSGEHLLEMINDVLDLSKIESGKVELEPGAFDLPRMLEDVGRMFNLRAQVAGLDFDMNIDPGLSRYINCDSGKLRQILINLLGNSVKFTREGGVVLSAWTVPDESDPDMVTLQLEVRDTGPGIDLPHQKAIFEPFVQMRDTSVKGTGLGLAITQSFVELMGGRINVESIPWAGSTFRVEIPVQLAESSSSEEQNIRKVYRLEPDQPDWHIMVVEDNEENRLLMSTMLERVGFVVWEARDGAEAVELFKQWHPHFIWMDMRMPVMNGYEATANIRNQPGGKEVKIVALTASALKDQKERITEAGCDEVLYKPFRPHELFACMRKHLGVRYRFDEKKDEKRWSSKTTGTKIKPESLSVLSDELFAELNNAAIALDVERFNSALESVDDIDSKLATGLQKLVDGLEFHKLKRVFGQAKPSSGNQK